MNRPVTCVFLVIVGVLAGGSAAGARENGPPTGEARFVEKGPTIDGRLDEGLWEGAPVLGGFRQKEPLEGEPATEETRVRVLYDRTNLYIGAELVDSAPAEIRATELRRDNDLESDDTFSVLIDSFHDHRNAFVFRLNPRGTRFDAFATRRGFSTATGTSSGPPRRPPPSAAGTGTTTSRTSRRRATSWACATSSRPSASACGRTSSAASRSWTRLRRRTARAGSATSASTT